jgi:acetyl-CoA carboxylase biotin carboxyl carrier protein
MNIFKEFKRFFVKFEEIKEYVLLLEENNLSKLQIKNKDFELLLEKNSYSPQKIIHVQPEPVRETKVVEEVKTGHFITSPMVGTYYASPAPNEPSFVKEGDSVSEESVVCIIEAMKVMNEVKAGIKGRIKEIYCKNGQPIEFGTKLFRIDPL